MHQTWNGSTGGQCCIFHMHRANIEEAICFCATGTRAWSGKKLILGHLSMYWLGLQMWCQTVHHSLFPTSFFLAINYHSMQQDKLMQTHCIFLVLHIYFDEKQRRNGAEITTSPVNLFIELHFRGSSFYCMQRRLLVWEDPNRLKLLYCRGLVQDCDKL